MKTDTRAFTKSRRNLSSTCAYFAFVPCQALLILFWLSAASACPAAPLLSAADYSSLTEAVARNPGRRIYVPDGRFEIDAPIVIKADHTALVGPGVIVQRTTNAVIIEIAGARDVLLRDLALTRPAGRQETVTNAVLVHDSQAVRLEDLRIHDNRSDDSAIRIFRCQNVYVERCSILDYKRIAIDDRTRHELYGHAFRCINGTGILVGDCVETHIVGNRIVEEKLLPSQEVQQRYDLGRIIKRSPNVGPLAPRADETSVGMWHQGSGIWVLGSEITRHTLIQGNFIENPAQGIDLACDFVTVTGNQVSKAYMGMKAMHGSRGVLIANNIFHAPDKYGILLRPGFLSRPGGSAQNGKPAAEPNIQGGIVVANNIITDIGYGNEGWRQWKPGPPDSKPVGLLLGAGPLPENPPMQDVLITGNIIYNTGADRVVRDGKLETDPPRYKYAVWVDQDPPPRGLHFVGNVFHPGEHGLSNIALKP